MTKSKTEFKTVEFNGKIKYIPLIIPDDVFEAVWYARALHDMGYTPNVSYDFTENRVRILVFNKEDDRVFAFSCPPTPLLGNRLRQLDSIYCDAMQDLTDILFSTANTKETPCPSA